MPTNNFKLFDENKANLLSDTEYVNATQRLNGVQTGVASSQLNNKFAYQVSLVAYAIAQIMNQNNLDASDTLSVSAFVGNLGAALLQKVADKASSTEAAAGVLNNKYITPATMKAAALLLSGGVMNGVLDMGGNKISNLATPTSDTDAVTKGYVDGKQIYEIGKYTGDGSVSKTLTFEKQFSFLKIALNNRNYGHYGIELIYGMQYCSFISTSSGYIGVTYSDNSVTITGDSTSKTIFYNQSSWEYYYIVFYK